MNLFHKMSALYKIGILLLTVFLILLMFPQEHHGTHYDYGVGSFWRDNDLYAPYDFSVTMSESEYQQSLNEARTKSMLYFKPDSTAHLQALQRLNTVERTRNLDAGKVRRLRKTIDSIYAKGYIERPADMPNIEEHTIILFAGNVGKEMDAGNVVSALDINDTLLTNNILVPSICYDATRTQLELDSRMSSFTSTMVQTGELIIAKGEMVTPEKAQVIHSLEQENDNRFGEHYSLFGHLLGQALLCIIAFLTLYLFMSNTNHPILEDNRKVTLVCSVILLMSAATAFMVHQNVDWVLLVPLCIVPILMRIFFDMRVALYIHLTTVIILANMVPNSFEFIFYQLITGMMSIITVRNFENRSKFFLVGFVIFCTYSLIYTSGVLSQDSNLSNINGTRYLVFFLNALLTLLSYPLIYLVEKVFGLTSSLTLLEISNTNTPLLRELSRKAPGTFQHSMQVSNISEDLINEIGGDSLLAKVGGLYHDVGKIVAPLNFTENQTSDFNPHDELDYVDSAKLITRHVTDGIALARRHHLPPTVIDFIRTHHGTTYTGYFYYKQKNAHPDEEIDASVFRYPGPTPYTREMAVVMIVDSVEAACKSLKDHTQEAIETMVEKIVVEKVESGQLNNCDLTFADISKIRQILKQRMLSIYHARISYPVDAGTNKK